MKWTEIARDYLAFTRKERIGILSILCLILAVIFLPLLLPSRSATAQQKPDTSWIAAIKKLEQKEATQEKENMDESNAGAYQYDLSVTNNNNKHKGELFLFDPNTLPASGWQKLGLRGKTIQTIQNYLGKGGRFTKPEDLRRIYGLHPDEYERLAPYIRIDSKTSTPERSFEQKAFADNKPVANKAPRYSTVNINTADTTAFINLPGIGNKLANRIVSFREKLGGFYAIEQVKETFGLPDSTFQNIKPYLLLENGTTRKINVNTATINELKTHPYIRYNIANAIVSYRNQHGSFSSLQDLKKIMLITDEVHQKIIPYLLL